MIRIKAQYFLKGIQCFLIVANIKERIRPKDIEVYIIAMGLRIDLFGLLVPWSPYKDVALP